MKLTIKKLEKLEKDIRRLVREDYTTGGHFGNKDEYFGLCFEYDTLVEKERKIKNFILSKLK